MSKSGKNVVLLQMKTRKAALYPAQKHDGKNSVSVSYDQSAASGNHTPAPPFQSHSTQTERHLLHGGRMLIQPQQGSSSFRTATPVEAEEPASFKQHPC